MILNNEIVSEDNLQADNFSGMNAFYEVIRIIDGTPLFFEDHIERLKDSLSTNGFSLRFSEEDLTQKAFRIVNENGLRNCNIKITVYARGCEQVLLMYISKSYYPGEDVVNQGVKLNLMNFERTDPQVKRVNPSLREGADKIMMETGAFEVLLVNRNGYITEGSKSNVFFIKGHNLYTSPEEFILKGITRKYILETCIKSGYNVIESMINVNELEQIDGLFISGTSIKVLPVSSIEGHYYNSSDNAVINEIRKRFDRFIDEYINEHKV